MYNRDRRKQVLDCLVEFNGVKALTVDDVVKAIGGENIISRSAASNALLRLLRDGQVIRDRANPKSQYLYQIKPGLVYGCTSNDVNRAVATNPRHVPRGFIAQPKTRGKKPMLPGERRFIWLFGRCLGLMECAAFVGRSIKTVSTYYKNGCDFMGREPDYMDRILFRLTGRYKRFIKALEHDWE